MMGSLDINWLYLGLAYVLMLVPFFIFFYFKTGLVQAAVWAIFRMTAQLLFVGFYLDVIFEIDDFKMNLLWVCVMMGVAGFTIVKRAEVQSKFFLLPVLSGLFAGLGTTLFFILIVVLNLPDPLTANYLIPLAGMILGNCLNTSIIGLRMWHRGLTKDKNLYLWHLTCGATQSEALAPFIKSSLQEAFSPAIATMATIGLVSLPGMMTGQILGGSSPVIAIKYQILIMICIMTATTITVVVTIMVSKFFFFDPTGMPRQVSS